MLIAWSGPGSASSEGEIPNVVRGTLYSYGSTTFGTFAPVSVAGHADYQLTSTDPADAQHDQINPDVAMSASGQFVLAW